MSGSAEHRPLHHIAVVGVGALGCAVLRSFSGMEDLLITIIDGDRVEAVNLHRQCLFSAADVGKAKVVAARERLELLDQRARIEGHDTFLHAENAEAVLAGQHVVLDCTDDLHAKDLMDRTCSELGIALVSGGLHATQGQVVVLHVEGDGSALQRADLFGGRAGTEQDGCDMRVVPTDVIQAVAERMLLLLNDILHGGSVTNGELAVYNANSWTTFFTNVPA